MKSVISFLRRKSSFRFEPVHHEERKKGGEVARWKESGGEGPGERWGRREWRRGTRWLGRAEGEGEGPGG